MLCLKFFGMKTLVVMSHIGWGGEQTTIYTDVETRFKALRGSSKGKAQRRQYLLPMDLGLDNLRERLDNLFLKYLIIYF